MRREGGVDLNCMSAKVFGSFISKNLIVHLGSAGFNHKNTTIYARILV